MLARQALHRLESRFPERLITHPGAERFELGVGFLFEGTTAGRIDAGQRRLREIRIDLRETCH